MVIAFPDADRDGYGVSEASDRHDDLGGRHLFCGSPLPGFVLAGGDCDDGDPTWSPDTVAIAAEAQCVDVEHDDRDADGVSPPVDPDDQDGTRWGQERDCRDGTDDDHDRLLDCEDGDCTDLPLCTEYDCDDGLDGDTDGGADCADEGCWQAESCTSVLAWVIAGRVEAQVAPILGLQLRAEDVRGRVRLEDAHGARSCTWSVDVAWRSSAPAVFPGQATWSRRGFNITPGCDVGSSVPRSLGPAGCAGGCSAAASSAWLGV